MISKIYFQKFWPFVIKKNFRTQRISFDPELSFIKGWGDNYTRRLVTDCPCWIGTDPIYLSYLTILLEISFLKCFEWLDKVMNQMGPPDGVGPTSTS